MNRREGPEGPRRRGFVSAGLTVAVLLSTGADPSLAEDTVVRWYDVRSLLAGAVVDPEGVDLRLPLAGAYLDRLEPDGYDVALEEHDESGPAAWLENALFDLGDRWPGGELDLEKQAGFLRVEASLRAQEAFSTVLSDLSRYASRAVQIEVFVLPATAAPEGTGAVLGTERTTELLAGVEPVDYSRKLTRLGQRAYLGGEGYTSILYDYDVEVATKARVADPQITVLPEGIELGVIVRESLAGGFRVRAWGRRSVPEETVRRVELPQFGGAALELPASASSMGVGSATLESGGSLLLRHGAGPDGVWLIRVTEREAATSSEGSGSRFVPLGDLTSTPLWVSSPWLPRTSPSGGYLPCCYESILEQLGEDATARVFYPEELRDRIRERAEELELDGAIALVGHVLYVRGTPSFLDWASREVVALERELTSETVEVDVRYAVLARGAALRMAAAEDPASLVERLDGRLLGACRMGETMLLLEGNERFYLMDHDVEIAQGSAIPDPIIGDVFDGVSFWCRPTRANGSALSAWVDLQVQEEARAGRELETPVWRPRQEEQTEDDPLPTGTMVAEALVELPATARARLFSNVALEDGQWVLLCCTALAGTDRSLVAVARAKVLPR